MRNLEAQEQATVVEWCDWMGVPIFHIPNGGFRNPREGRNLKLQGVRAGVPDLFIPVASGGFHGLFVEMKKEGGRLSPKQREWLQLLNRQGYKAVSCIGAGAAIDTIKEYIHG